MTKIYLREPSRRSDYLDAIEFIPLSSNGDWHLTLSDVATLLDGTNTQKAAGGILLTLEKPAKPMRHEAVDAGRYESRASGATRIIQKSSFSRLRAC